MYFPFLALLKADSGLYPAVSQMTPYFTKPAHTHRNEAIRSLHQGCDTGPDPPYLQSATAEPKHEFAGGLWHEDRGKEGRKIMAPGGVRGGGHGGFKNGFGQQPQQPEGEAAAGLSSSVIQASRKTRTGLKLGKDCWGNVIPH